MRKYTIIVLLTLLCAEVSSCSQKTSNVKLNNKQDSLSWVLGESYATAIQNMGLHLNNEVILNAMRRTLENGTRPLDQDTYQRLLMELNNQLLSSQQTQMSKQQNDNTEREKTYFETLKTKVPGLKQTPEGFYYEVLQEGKGTNATHGSVVVFDYRSYFASNGELYDQTYGNREPIKHVVGSPMFQGLQEAFTYMNAGSKYRFYFPYEKAFGSQGDMGAGIPPYSTMIYEVELHEIH